MAVFDAFFARDLRLFSMHVFRLASERNQRSPEVTELRNPLNRSCMVDDQVCDKVRLKELFL